jgi:hypothetical protein
MNKAWKLVLTLTAMLAAGCGEGAVAPPNQAADTHLIGGGSSASLSGTDTLRFSFYIDPSRTVSYSLGQGNSISFPAHSLCDLSSTYGPTEWDQPCALATRSVNISTKAWLDRTGHPHIDFSPSVRFVPSVNPADWVILTFGDAWAAQDPLYNIFYCVTGNTTRCVNEATTDPSLATLRDPITGRIYRRVKHFSGYMVGADGCDPSDPSCTPPDSGAFNRIGLTRSGTEH